MGIPAVGLAGDWPGGWTQTYAQVDTEAGIHGFDKDYFVQQAAGLSQLAGEFMLVKPLVIDLGWGINPCKVSKSFRLPYGRGSASLSEPRPAGSGCPLADTPSSAEKELREGDETAVAILRVLASELRSIPHTTTLYIDARTLGSTSRGRSYFDLLRKTKLAFDGCL